MLEKLWEQPIAAEYQEPANRANFADLINKTVNAYEKTENCETEKYQTFLEEWVQKLLQMFEYTNQTHPIKVDIISLIKEWLENVDHGALHSFHTREGAMYMADQENVNDPKDRETLEVISVIHDIAQMFPSIHPHTSNHIDTRRLHHNLIAGYIYKLAGDLGVDPERKREAVLSLYYHDITYQQTKNSKLYQTAKNWLRKNKIGGILHDADKLFGGGVSTDPAILLNMALERNAVGTKGAYSGYICRDDISTEKLRQWEYGDRWFSSWTAAVGSEVYNMEFMTDTGIKFGEARREFLDQQAEKVYGQLFDETRENILDWQKNFNNYQIILTGKDQKEEPSPVVENMEGIKILIDTTLSRPLILKDTYRRQKIYEPEDTRGWKVVIEAKPNGQLQTKKIIIDPSVGKYAACTDDQYEENKKLFIKAVLRNIQAFKE